MITLDTSAVLSILDRKDAYHEQVVNSLTDAGRPFFVSIAMLSELAYMVEARFGADVLVVVLEDVCEHKYELDWDDGDAVRIKDLVERYRDLPLGLADAAVVACAERNGGKILTLDSDFDVVAREGLVETCP